MSATARCEANRAQVRLKERWACGNEENALYYLPFAFDRGELSFTPHRVFFVLW